MKKKSFIYSLLASVVALAPLASCTDDFEEVNTNPNKIYNVELGDVWAGTVKRSMDLFSEANYNRLLNFSRSIIVQYSTNASQDTGDGYFKKFYIEILRDLVKLEREYSKDTETYASRLAIIKTWKSYCFYFMTSMYGPIPMSDAISDGSDNKRYYAYDSEDQIYTAILNDLTEAYELFGKDGGNNVADAMDMDPVFGVEGGKPDIDKWRRFCNSLRLNIAMHIQNLNPELSRSMALEAMNGDLIQSNDGNVNLRYGTMLEKSASWYYNRFIYNRQAFKQSEYPAMSEYFYIYLASFDDPRLPKYFHKSNELATGNEPQYVFQDTITREHKCFSRSGSDYSTCPNYKKHQADGFNKFRRDSIVIEVTAPYVPFCELAGCPTSYEWGTIPGDQNNTRYVDPLWKYNGEYNPSFIQEEFVNETSALTLLTYADVCFLKAEASILYKGDVGAAKAFYEEGIMASMTRHGVTDYAAYLNHDGIKWGTSYKGYHDRRMFYQAKIEGARGNEGYLEQIYKQRYFADIMMPLEQWNMERRTRALDFPPFFLSRATTNVDGVNDTYNYWTERLVYPNAEHIKNGAACAEGVAKMQAASPYARGERSGDNVFTHLAFAKKVPGIENADAVWGAHRFIYPQLEYFHNMWGSTYDEVLASAKEYTGESVASFALGKIKYKWLRTHSIYPTPDMPVIEEDEDE